jgi:hypothetical protein
MTATDATKHLAEAPPTSTGGTFHDENAPASQRRTSEPDRSEARPDQDAARIPTPAPQPPGQPRSKSSSSTLAAAAAATRCVLAAVESGELDVNTPADRTALRRLEGTAQVLDVVAGMTSADSTSRRSPDPQSGPGLL